MKFYEAIEIVRNRRVLSEEDFDEVENNGNMAKELEEAIKAIEKDLLKLRRVVENKIITHLAWTKFASNNYLTVFDNYYKFADGCALLLRGRDLYDRAPSQGAKDFLLKKYLRKGRNISSKESLEISIKSLSIYFGLVRRVMEITKLIRQYNEFDFVKKNKWQLNIPTVEFHFNLRQVEVSQRWKEMILKNS